MILKTTTSNEVTNPLPAPATPAGRLLTADQFQRLADVPPEIEWFANLGNKATRRAYENALGDFMKFTGIVKPEEFRGVTRAHVIAWRDDCVFHANWTPIPRQTGHPFHVNLDSRSVATRG